MCLLYPGRRQVWRSELLHLDIVLFFACFLLFPVLLCSPPIATRLPRPRYRTSFSYQAQKDSRFCTHMGMSTMAECEKMTERMVLNPEGNKKKKTTSYERESGRNEKNWTTRENIVLSCCYCFAHCSCCLWYSMRGICLFSCSKR